MCACVHMCMCAFSLLLLWICINTHLLFIRTGGFLHPSLLDVNPQWNTSPFLSFLCPLSLGIFPSAVIKRAFCLSVLMSVPVITLGERRSSPPVCSWTSVINSAAALRTAAGAPPVTVDAWDVCGLCVCVRVCVRTCLCAIEGFIWEHCYPQVSNSVLGLIGDCCLWWITLCTGLLA